MLHLFTRLFAKRPTTSRPKHRAHLQLESLDGRVMPSAKVLADIHFTPEELHSMATQKTIKRTIKKNTITVKYLSPGNYSVSYGSHGAHGHTIVAHARTAADIQLIELD